jgi:hypothetical protein
MLTKDKILDFLIYTSIFVSSIVFFTSPFEGYLHYIIFLLLLPFFIGKYGFPKAPFQILALPFIASVFQVMMGNDTWFLFLKIFIGMMLSMTFYYYVILHYDYDIEKMFALYLKWAYWTAIIGIIQYVSYRVNFAPGYDYSWILNKTTGITGGRICSIYGEPSQLAIMLSPAVFVAIVNLIRKQQYGYKNYQNYIILITFYIAKSSTGYIGVFFAIVVIGLNIGYISYLVAFIFVGIIGSFAAYNSIDEVKSRADAAINLWVYQDFSIKNVNTSSFVQYNNAYVAYENLKEHPFFGTGLGSHPVAYEKYSLTNTDKISLKNFNNNTSDANSIFLRLMSETGLVGVLFMLAIVFRCFVGSGGNYENNLWIISGALLTLIFLYLLRQGNYFYNGFPFFVWLYYYTKVVHNKSLE